MKNTTITILIFILFTSAIFIPLIMDFKSEEQNNQIVSLKLEEVPTETTIVESVDINEAVLPIGQNSRIEEELLEGLINKGGEEKVKQTKLLPSVPFIAQAPLGNWSDPRQQDGCEEAGVLMAMTWVNNGSEPSLLEAEEMIIELADWQQEKYGEYRDLHINEVASRLFVEYFDYNQVEIKEVSEVEELIEFLEQGYLILAPTNGQVLQNPHFTSPGPERHLLVVIGYDYEAELFTTHDPGTRQGRNFKYPKERLFKAIRAYPSGYHQPIVGQEKLILIVSR